METSDIIILTGFILAIVLTISLAVVFSVPRLYSYVFEHKDWKLWKEYINRVDEFEFDNSIYSSYEFKIPNTEINAQVWKDTGLCSIHSDTKCLCCTFHRYYSKKMADLLMTKVKTEKENNYVQQGTTE